MAKNRSRLQVDLAARHERLLGKLGERLGSGADAETARRIFDIVADLAQQIEHGFKLVVAASDDERPDAVPELTRALVPASEYTYLVQRPHPWRKQLFVKGRRLTAGQVLHAMHVNGWTTERTATEFDMPLGAVREAVDYGERFGSLIAAEDAEDAIAAKRVKRAATAG